MGQAGQVIQGQVLLKMVIDIAADELALLAGPGARDFAGEGQVLLPLQADEHHLQQVAADLLVTWGGVGRLLEHQTHAAVQLRPAVGDVEHGIALLGGGGLQPLDTQDNVLQRAFQGAHFRVGYIGIDNEQVLNGDGEFLIQSAEMAVAVQNKEQLRTIVGVELRAPVGGELVLGDVAQAGRSVPRLLWRARAVELIPGHTPASFPLRFCKNVEL